ncbi:WD40-repeat-containing domain protein [Phycomyces nitens]|nr:WD40-repeat-containing domain protein [Phycomyces nitens]
MSKLHDEYDEFLATIYSKFMEELEHKWDIYGSTIKNTTLYKIAEKIYSLSGMNLPIPTGPHSDHHMFHTRSDDILSIAWHPYTDRLALAHKDNTVYIYERDPETSRWTCALLKHKFMNDITCLEWKPRAGGVLAVGCRHGVCVWDLYAKRVKGAASVSTNPQHQTVNVGLHPTAWMSYFRTPGQDNISSIAWDPSLSSNVFVAASTSTSTLVAYDIVTHLATPLKRHGKGNVLLRWSPDGNWLYSATMAGASRMWNTKTWASVKFSNPPGLWVKTACWSPDSKSIFYSMRGKRDLYALHRRSSTTDVVWDFSKVDGYQTTVMSGERVVPIGKICEISLDPKNGDRLAVAYEDSEVVAIYDVLHTEQLAAKNTTAVSLIGLARGSAITNEAGHLGAVPMAGARPTHLSFSPSCKKGALLAVVYDNNIISFLTHQYASKPRSQVP